MMVLGDETLRLGVKTGLGLQVNPNAVEEDQISGRAKSFGDGVETGAHCPSEGTD